MRIHGAHLRRGKLGIHVGVDFCEPGIATHAWPQALSLADDRALLCVLAICATSPYRPESLVLRLSLGNSSLLRRTTEAPRDKSAAHPQSRRAPSHRSRS